MKLKGRIINIVSSIFYVEAEEKIYECTSRGIFKTKELKPVVGDNVLIELENEKGNILEMLDRKKYIKRPKMANLTQLILVVSSKNPVPDLLMLDKQLAFAEFLEVEPIIVVNKIDLDEETANNIEKIYSKIGYKVIKTNAKESINIEKIKEILKGQISGFSGNSGVGKSSLTNALMDTETIKTSTISSKSKRGRHTTTSSKYYIWDEDSSIIDTPGIRSLDVSNLNPIEIQNYFKEFSNIKGSCKYKSCLHYKEPKDTCTIKQAVENNAINRNRYESYLRILKDTLNDK